MKPVINNLRANLPNSYLASFPHYTCLGPNLHAKSIFPLEDESYNVKDLIALREPTPFKCTIPLPLLPMKSVPESFLYGKDPGLEIVEKKARWKAAINQELTSFLRFDRVGHLRGIQFELDVCGSIKQLPSYVIVLAKLLGKDPDDQFDGFYNWYYSGGCLNQITLQGNKILLRSGGDKFDRLDAVPLTSDKNVHLKADLQYMAYSSIGNNVPICQIVSDEINGYIGVRQMKKCFIFSLSKNGDNLKLSKVQELSTSHPFTNIDFDKSTAGNYVTINTKSQAVIKNMNKRSVIRRWNVPDCSNKFVDKWCSAIYGQNNDTVICANRHYLRTYDTRAKRMNCMEICPKESSGILEKCEEITCMIEGTKKCSHPLLYVATHHQLLAMDLRFPRAFIQRWTHGMKFAPSYICTASVNDVTEQNQLEVILLRSQISNELHTIVNCLSGRNEYDTPFSSVFPQSIPSYNDTLALAHWHGKLLDPLVQKRLSMITVGMCCFDDQKGGITCMSQNSIGDVFQQHLIPKDRKHNVKVKKVLHCISKWEKSKPRGKKPHKKLEVVVRTDMKNMFRRLAVLSNEIKPFKKKVVPSDWKMSKRELLRFDDKLAPEILKVWEIDNELEWKSGEENIEDSQASLPPTQEPLDKVEKWLGAMNLFSSTPIALPDSQDVQHSNVPQFLTSQFSECLSDSFPTPKVNVKRKISILGNYNPKKKRHIDGF